MSGLFSPAWPSSGKAWCSSLMTGLRMFMQRLMLQVYMGSGLCLRLDSIIGSLCLRPDPLPASQQEQA